MLDLIEPILNALNPVNDIKIGLPHRIPDEILKFSGRERPLGRSLEVAFTLCLAVVVKTHLNDQRDKREHDQDDDDGAHCASVGLVDADSLRRFKACVAAGDHSAHQVLPRAINAWMPVISRPRISPWMSNVPS